MRLLLIERGGKEATRRRDSGKPTFDLRREKYRTAQCEAAIARRHLRYLFYEYCSPPTFAGFCAYVRSRGAALFA
jgi:hypothetical protein